MKSIPIFVCLLLANTAFSQRIFHSLPSFLEYVDAKSISLKSSSIKELQAKKARLAALVGIAEQGTNSASFIDNTKLPVSILPADAFGGQPGTTKEITTGTHYNTSVQNTVDIKLLNLEGWDNLKLSKINLEITKTDSKIAQKSLYENIASAYYNIVQLQEQLKSTQRNISVSDSLLLIVQSKYDAGLVKQQDVNDSRVNLLGVQENERQIRYLILQNYLSLKILADIPNSENVVVDEQVDETTPIKPAVEKNNLSHNSMVLKEQYALRDYKRNKMAQLPTLSLVGSQSFNQYNQHFTLSGGNWVSSNYVGLKLSVPITGSKTIANKYNARYDYELARQNCLQAAIKAELDCQKLGVDCEKALSQVHSHAEILFLQRDTYARNKKLYTEGLQGLDRTLNSLNTMINAEYNLINSKVGVLLAKAKIDINNQIN